LSTRGNLVHPTTPFIEFDKREQSIPARFEQQVIKSPDKIAVKTKRYTWTYRDLNDKANQVAQAILEQEERVALLFEHDAHQLVGIMGVLKAGKTYVPLDPDSPRERLEYIVQDSQASAILTNDQNLSLAQTLTNKTIRLINIDKLETATNNIQLTVSPDSIAYILYTSGSTGHPKGVLQNHRNVRHFIRNYTNNLHITANDRLTLLSSYSFDAAIMDIFGALLNGATLYPVNLKEESLSNLTSWLIQQELTLYHSTPTVYRHWLNTLTEEKFPKIRFVVLGGEPVYKDDVDKYRKHFTTNCIFINGLGPTESTVSLQYFINHQTEITHQAVPVGYPVEETEILLLNEAGEETDIYGEIAIKSPYIALGYWQKPEITQAVFVTDEDNQRLYRTGDMGRLRADGSIEFVGRKDFQVKLRGFRIELGEIEAVLSQHPAVQETVVMLREEPAGEKRLIAYLVPNPEQVIDNIELRTFITDRLPNYMIASAFVQLETMPLTPTGKIDRRALPAPDMVETKREDTFVTPRTLTEEMLARIWVDILSIESFQRNSTQINIHDNFFDIGGHSLFAARLIDQVRKVFQVELPLRRLFEFPTIAGLGKCIETERHAQPQAKCWSSLVPIQVSGSKKPFFLVPGGGGSEGEFMVYAKLVYLLGHEQPVYGLQAHGLDGEQVPQSQVETMATEYLKEIRAFQPNGPYLLGGECIGGLVAFEMAQQLQAQGQKVALLILLDTVYLNGVDYVTYLVYRQIRKIKHHWKTLSKFESHEWLPYLFDKAKKVRWRLIAKFHLNSVPSAHRIQHVKNNYVKTLRRYRPKPYPGHMVLMATEANYEKNSILRWETLAAGGLEIYKLPGDHTSYLGEQVQATAKQLKACLDEAQEGL
jgi:amino acid adenylation domain-containing protein